MTLGLIIIEEMESLKKTISILKTNKDTLLGICNNYLIYTKHNKTEFLYSLSSISELYDITYDIADDMYINKDTLKDFHALIYLNYDGLQYSY